MPDNEKPLVEGVDYVIEKLQPSGYSIKALNDEAEREFALIFSKWSIS